MTVDISRVSFAPRRNYAGTLEQQGRVRLDADGNEDWAIGDRRWRSETYDILDRVALPVALPDSFRIDVVAGAIVVQPGRLYVDGLQAENHGDAPFVWSPILAELRGTGPVRYDAQPFRPGLAGGALSPGRHILYLDVWQRTVTHLEDPTLIEAAVGVDTTARVQTVWQVRDLADAGNATCATPDAQLPGWLAATAPTAGRLSSRAHVGPPQTDPCLLPPGSGYTGLENRIYRVEIHGQDAAGAWRFKWAAHNATVATAILALPAADVLRVARVAKDDVMRFNPGDWVEVTDDRRELGGTAGVVRRVQAVDDAARTLTLADPLPAGLLAITGGGPDLDPQFHPRVRRWDQAGPVRDSNGALVVDLSAAGSDGLIPVPVPGTFLQLGDGVEVAFGLDPAGGSFRIGDYWLFTARTAGRVVEELVAAPPLGIHHHYCRLAVVDVAAGAAPVVVEDCRPRPDDAGCCSFVIEPGESIQAAVDALPDAGGCICLKAGLHLIDAPIRIARPDVTLHGESLGAIVQGRGPGSLLEVDGISPPGIHVHDIDWRAPAVGAPLIAIGRCEGLTIERCRIAAVEGRGGAIGVLATGADDLRIAGCEFDGLAAGIWLDERCMSPTLVDNRLRMAEPGPNNPTSVGILARGVIGPLIAERNEIDRAIDGIVVNSGGDDTPASLATGSRLVGNRIELAAAPDDDRNFAIDVAASHATVAENVVSHRGGRAVGIRATGSGSNVSGNSVVAQTKTPEFAVGIIVGHEADNVFRPVERVTVAANRIEGPQYGITVLGAARAVVSGNQLGRVGEPFGFGIVLNEASDTIVADNMIFGALVGLFSIGGQRNRIAGNVVSGGALGLGAANEAAPAIAQNRLSGCSAGGLFVLGVAGRCEVIENRVVDCGFGAENALGIGVFGVFGEFHAEANEVMNTGVAPTGVNPSAQPRTAIGISGDLILEARVQSNLVTYSDPNARPAGGQDRALQMRGLIEATVSLGREQLTIGYAIQIADNKFIGPGATALVELRSQVINDNIRSRFERVQFSGNYCLHTSLPFNDAVQAATVVLVGRRCSVSANHVKATTAQFRSYHFNGMPGPFIGNVSHGPNFGRTGGNIFPAPETAFNQIA